VNRESTEVDTIASSVTDIESKTRLSLETQVSAGGANFSQGQRQLIAMARALLRHSSIIVLDEATSSIDFATDAKIQTAIREEFMESLLLTVAHRLRTVIDYDRLIVLDKGKISEFDTPWNLIQKRMEFSVICASKVGSTAS
ncbi:P-loop containing nucleoside triphosphate hydrolase protein, partial [Cyathus striatus]